MSALTTFDIIFNILASALGKKKKTKGKKIGKDRVKLLLPGNMIANKEEIYN